jgi:voltage-gated potassium channel
MPTENLMLNYFKKARLLIILPVAIIVIGTFGFMAIEKLSFLDALYFTFVTVGTVGYGDIHPVTAAGKIFDMVLIVFGIGTFLAVVTSLTQSLVARDQASMRKNRISMLISLYFTEVGNQMLRLFVQYDPAATAIRGEFLVSARWATADFEKLKAIVGKRDSVIDAKLVELERLRDFLKEKGGFLTRQLENPDLTENESYAELLWASVHLRDELMARPHLHGLPDSDLNHIAGDTRRVYNLLVKQWLGYMEYLQGRYPYLFSLAVRTNPFVENPSPTVAS